MLDHLYSLKTQIEKDLKVTTDLEGNEYHIKALNAIDVLIGYLL